MHWTALTTVVFTSEKLDSPFEYFEARYQKENDGKVTFVRLNSPVVVFSEQISLTLLLS
jgi:hypothetical protein